MGKFLLGHSFVTVSVRAVQRPLLSTSMSDVRSTGGPGHWARIVASALRSSRRSSSKNSFAAQVQVPHMASVSSARRAAPHGLCRLLENMCARSCCSCGGRPWDNIHQLNGSGFRSSGGQILVGAQFRDCQRPCGTAPPPVHFDVGRAQR